jgi:hypothetical protein
MHATRRSPALCALIIGSLASASAYADDAVAFGAEARQVTQSNQRRALGVAAEKVQRAVASAAGALKVSAANNRGSAVGQSAARSAQQKELPHAGGPSASRNRVPAVTAHDYPSPTVGAAVANGRRVGSSGGDRPFKRTDPGPEATHGVRTVTAAPAASRQFTRTVRAASASTANLQARPGNGVLGGPQTPGRSMLGGPANGRTVARTGIDGAALHRRL